jgi:hypothetical protein
MPRPAVDAAAAVGKEGVGSAVSAAVSLSAVHLALCGPSHDRAEDEEQDRSADGHDEQHSRQNHCSTPSNHRLTIDK